MDQKQAQEMVDEAFERELAEGIDDFDEDGEISGDLQRLLECLRDYLMETGTMRLLVQASTEVEEFVEL